MLFEFFVLLQWLIAQLAIYRRFGCHTEFTRQNRKSISPYARERVAGWRSAAFESPHADEENTIRVPITRYRNMAAVTTIDTSDVLYAVPSDESSDLIGPPWSASDVQIGAAAGAISTALVSGLVVLRTVYGRTEEPERIDSMIPDVLIYNGVACFAVALAVLPQGEFAIAAFLLSLLIGSFVTRLSLDRRRGAAA